MTIVCAPCRCCTAAVLALVIVPTCRAHPSQHADHSTAAHGQIGNASSSAPVLLLSPPPADAQAPVDASIVAEAASPACADYRSNNTLQSAHDPHGPSRAFGYDGYVFLQIELSMEGDAGAQKHCVDVLWPAGDKNSAGKSVQIGKRIKPSWLRLIERTLARLPWPHVLAIHRFVIDNRPLLHGVAPFDRGLPEQDARDGHSIWLHEHLFTEVNHWVHGNFGHYWAYHCQRDGISVDGQGPDHDLFSPVLLHEIGHIVNYNLVNRQASDATSPKCSEMCGDWKNCKALKQAQREAPCATAYCSPFEFISGTENWAEMYRWYYQGSSTRMQLGKSFQGCFQTLGGINSTMPAPWEVGLGEVAGYRKTRWDSCRGGACKEY